MGIRCSVKSQVIEIRQLGTKHLYVSEAYILIGMIKFLEKYGIWFLLIRIYVDGIMDGMVS